MIKKSFHEIFSRNLSMGLVKIGKRQIDLSNDLNIPKATVSSWCCGSRLPKLDALPAIASYLNIDDPILLLRENFEDSIQ